MSDRHQYQNPPIKEAVCEFRFGPKQDWDPLLPGRLQHALEELGEEYTGKARELRTVSIGLQTSKGSPPNVRYDDEGTKIQLTTNDSTRMVGVGASVLSIHMLRPYQDPANAENVGWDEFRPRIEKALSAYCDVAKPDGVCRIGIRYINKIVVPQENIVVSDYLRYALPKAGELPGDYLNFLSRVEYVYDDGVRLVLLQSPAKVESGNTGLALDIDVFWEALGSELISKDEAWTKVRELRSREREVFEVSITNKARNLFDA